MVNLRTHLSVDVIFFHGEMFSSECTCHGFELVQARVQYLLTLLKRLLFVLQNINCTGCNKHVHEFLIIDTKQFQSKCYPKTIPALQQKNKNK